MKQISLPLAGLVALSLGLLTTPAQAAPPASASSSTSAATGDVSANGGVIIVIFEAPIAIQDRMKNIQWETINLGHDPKNICLDCAPLLETPNLREELPLDRERIVHRNVMGGLHHLGLAHTAENPELEKRYREVALTSFSEAVKVAEKTTPEFTALGYYDVESKTSRPDQNEALDALAVELTNGLALLREAINTGSPELFKEATVRFDAAYFSFTKAALHSGIIIIDH